MRVLDAPKKSSAFSTGSTGGGGSFKKGGFKSSFTAVKGPAAPTAPIKKNVLGENDDEQDYTPAVEGTSDAAGSNPDRVPGIIGVQGESDTDEEYLTESLGSGYYDPRRPTDCFPGCIGSNHAQVQAP